MLLYIFLLLFLKFIQVFFVKNNRICNHKYVSVLFLNFRRGFLLRTWLGAPFLRCSHTAYSSNAGKQDSDHT